MGEPETLETCQRKPPSLQLLLISCYTCDYFPKIPETIADNETLSDLEILLATFDIQSSCHLLLRGGSLHPQMLSRAPFQPKHLGLEVLSPIATLVDSPPWQLPPEWLSLVHPQSTAKWTSLIHSPYLLTACCRDLISSQQPGQWISAWL